MLICGIFKSSSEVSISFKTFSLVWDPGPQDPTLESTRNLSPAETVPSLFSEAPGARGEYMREVSSWLYPRLANASRKPLTSSGLSKRAILSTDLSPT